MKPDKIEKTANKIRQFIDLNELIVYEALCIWEECPFDFCIQHQTEDSIIFGAVNRVIWTSKHGFNIDESYCTKRFIEHFKEWKNG